MGREVDNGTYSPVLGQTLNHACWSGRSGVAAAVIEIPETAYAVLGEDRIAYQVFGEGELDLIWFPGGGDCVVDLRWDWPRTPSSSTGSRLEPG